MSDLMPPMFSFMRDKNRQTAPLRKEMASQLKKARRLRRDNNRIGHLMIKQYIKAKRRSRSGVRVNVTP